MTCVLNVFFVKRLLSCLTAGKHDLSGDRFSLLGPHEGEGMLLQLQGL